MASEEQKSTNLALRPGYWLSLLSVGLVTGGVGFFKGCTFTSDELRHGIVVRFDEAAKPDTKTVAALQTAVTDAFNTLHDGNFTNGPVLVNVRADGSAGPPAFSETMRQVWEFFANGKPAPAEAPKPIERPVEQPGFQP